MSIDEIDEIVTDHRCGKCDKFYVSFEVKFNFFPGERIIFFVSNIYSDKQRSTCFVPVSPIYEISYIDYRSDFIDIWCIGEIFLIRDIIVTFIFLYQVGLLY